MLTVTTAHKHGPEDEFCSSRSLERTMKEEVAKLPRGGTKKVYQKCSREASEPARNKVTYARLASTLLKHKRKFQPKI